MIRFVAALTLMLTLAASTAAQGAPPGRNGRILYTGLGGGRSQIFSASPDGTHVRQLTHFTDSDAADASWSADGKRIAFARDYDAGKPNEHLDIYTMNADGSDPHGMGFKGLNGGPVWFPDGKRLLYGRAGHGLDGLWVVPAAGGTPRRVLRIPGGPESQTISPDGTKVAFLRDKARASALFVANLASKQMKQVTPWSLNAKPKVDWSPDGTLLLSRTEKGDIFTIHPDGSGLTVLVKGNDLCSESFSPDGTKIVYVAHCSHDGHWRLYTANSDGTSARPIGNLHGHWASWGTAAS